MALNLWPKLLQQDAQVIKERLTFSILGRASVENDSILYYPSIASDIQKKMPFTELVPERSRTDLLQRVTSVFVLAVSLVVPVYFCVISVFVADWGRPAAIVGLLRVSAFTIPLVCLLPVILVTSHFIKLDKDWNNAIEKLFDGDNRSKMLGVKQVILLYRRYVRWHRIMAYLLTPSWSVLFLGGIIATLDAIRTRQIWIGELGYLVLVLFIFSFVVVAWFSYMRWYHTSNRDPTLQLCVMLAEENRNIAALRRPYNGA
jgi:hypothetical protein